MSSNNSITAPYLRTTRNFPDIPEKLSDEVDKAYIDIAACVNNRTIGLFPIRKPIVTGESWFLDRAREQQTLRQVYPITSLTNFNHLIRTSSISTFTVIRGIGFNAGNWYPIPYLDAVTPTNNVGIFVTPTQVVFTNGGTQVATAGFILLEWLSEK